MSKGRCGFANSESKIKRNSARYAAWHFDSEYILRAQCIFLHFSHSQTPFLMCIKSCVHESCVLIEMAVTCSTPSSANSCLNRSVNERNDDDVCISNLILIPRRTSTVDSRYLQDNWMCWSACPMMPGTMNDYITRWWHWVTVTSVFVQWHICEQLN